jgi:hypothetical protein
MTPEDLSIKLPLKSRHIPARLATGAFILNSGIEKSRGDEQTAQALHGMASGSYPFLGKMESTDFLKALSTTEIALGVALLLPVVPTAVAGAGLAAFSAGLLGLYLRTPGMRQEGSLRPTQQGTAIAKTCGCSASRLASSWTRSSPPTIDLWNIAPRTVFDVRSSSWVIRLPSPRDPADGTAATLSRPAGDHGSPSVRHRSPGRVAHGMPSARTHKTGVLLRRIVVTILGVALVVVGVLLLVLPGPGLLLVLAGLIVLANEYPWAQRHVAPVRRQAIAAARFSVASRLRIAWTAMVGLALVVAGIVWMAVPSLPFGGVGTGSSLVLSGVILLGLLAYSARRWGGPRNATAGRQQSRVV